MSHVSGELFVPAPLLSGPLGPILSKALAREPADRYPNGHAFLDALRTISYEDIGPIPAAAPLERLGFSSSEVLPRPPNTLDDLATQDTMAMAAIPTAELPESVSKPKFRFALILLLGVALLIAGQALRSGDGGQSPASQEEGSSAALISPESEGPESEGPESEGPES
ncbi:MAG: hypothetical protein ACNA8W_26930, partial [Bradymonadaceae bacterium]